MLLVVGVAGVAAVDDDVAGLEQAAELARRSPVVGSPDGHHHPDHARLRQLLDQLLEGGDVARRRLVAVEADDRVAAAAQPLGHVAAHLAEPDETDLHRDLRDLASTSLSVAARVLESAMPAGDLSRAAAPA